MRRVPWTYELPAAGTSDSGIEQYQVVTPSGDVGKAAALLRREDETFLAVAPSGLPVTHHLVAIPVDDVAGVDHDSLTVRVRALDGAVELDPRRAVEQGPAEARRLTELPPQLRPLQPTGDVAGPVDRLRVFGSLAAAAVGFVSLLGAVAAIGEGGPVWRFALLVLPVTLLLLALVFGLSAWRRPYEPGRPRARRPAGS